MRKPKRRPRSWRRAVTVAIVLVGIGAATLWWRSEGQNAAAGAPRLVVDRTDVDLGYFLFEKRASAVFTLTNAGDGTLLVLDVPPVRAVQGC